MRAIISAAVVLASPSAAEPPRTAEVDAELRSADARAASSDIVVYGHRDSERYRLPPELRGQSDKTSGWRSIINRDFACHNVGPFGCGAKGLPIITFRSDGKVQIGEADGGN